MFSNEVSVSFSAWKWPQSKQNVQYNRKDHNKHNNLPFWHVTSYRTTISWLESWRHEWSNLHAWQRTILYEQVMASKFSGSNFLELATEFDTWRFFWHQHFWSQSSPCIVPWYYTSLQNCYRPTSQEITLQFDAKMKIDKIKASNRWFECIVQWYSNSIAFWMMTC